ncbi:MAG TPA: hypothetical protein VLF20_00535 [Patescibacteria group bacterium]|nr:hypothetical protein [Patescibacteria group bacterium]
MKRIAILSVLFLFLAFIVTPALAENASDRMTVGSKAAERKAKAQEKIETRSADRTASLQERADKEITRRITSLQKLITRINEFKKISSTQKASLTSQVQTEIDALIALQEKIAAGTDQATLKEDVQSIITSYRIYAVFIPKIHLLGSADRILTIADEMTTHAEILAEKIAAEEAKGTDVTDAEALLADMQTKITDAKAQAQSAITSATAITPEGYPENKTDLQNVRQQIITAIHDLNTARQDARKITVWLIQQNGGSLKPATP